jgi:hypothetical protein
MDSIWTPYGLYMDSIWTLYGLHMDSIWALYGLYMDSIWTPWTLYGLHMDSIWRGLSATRMRFCVFPRTDLPQWFPRSRKLRSTEPSQYLDGWPLTNGWTIQRTGWRCVSQCCMTSWGIDPMFTASWETGSAWYGSGSPDQSPGEEECISSAGTTQWNWGSEIEDRKSGLKYRLDHCAAPKFPMHLRECMGNLWGMPLGRRFHGGNHGESMVNAFGTHSSITKLALQ